MKLYATVTSERASKGQGGNKNLDIVLQAGSERKEVGRIFMQVLDDKRIVVHSSVPETSGLGVGTFYLPSGELETKGKRQKGECPHKNTEWRDEKGKSYLNCFDCGEVLRTKEAV